MCVFVCVCFCVCVCVCVCVFRGGCSLYRGVCLVLNVGVGVMHLQSGEGQQCVLGRRE